MSNALSLLGQMQSVLGTAGSATQATAPTSQWSQRPTVAESLMLALVAMGLVVALVWVLRRLARPSKLSLKRTPGRINTLNPVHLLLIFALWLIVTSGASALFGGVCSLDKLHVLTLSGIAGQTVWLAASLIVAAVTFRGGLVRGLGLSARHWIYDSGRGILAYLGIWPVCIGLLSASAALFIRIYNFPPPEHRMLDAMESLTLPWKVAAIFSAVVLGPLAEEVFCRGLLQSMFRRYLGSPWLAILLASAIFTLLHWDSFDHNGHAMANWTPLAPMFALAMCLGYNYERCGRLLPPILTHAIFNAINVVLFLCQR
ncbi:MAG: CPBP family intramembrane glutamic endopeptidase [Phycisphaerae bacterium]